MIDLESARQLLDFEGSGRITKERADEQLAGAVAMHNLLSKKEGVAYLADEVGMGKTYVALGAMALFRHFNPDFRVLVIAPRENIQRKWQKELRNFVANNVRISDLRVAGPDGGPARAIVHCNSLVDLAHEACVDPNRDFFLRMTSFSLALGAGAEGAWKARDGIRRALPWLDEGALDLRMNKDDFKRSFARALCCALPQFDLVVIDEAHNLKHGFGPNVSARNRVLGEAFGRHMDDDPPGTRFRGYGRRAHKVMFLSATPLEESYRHVWNQLDLFGLAEPFEGLRSDKLKEEQKKELVGRFLVRRVTSISVAGRTQTKNMYRRSWRRGGLTTHDEPIEVRDPKQRLIVALVQKKVSELLSGKQFNRSFQIGMLASFESFLETARLKRDDEDHDTVFDDSEQADSAAERDGMDVRDLNRLAKSYAKEFEGAAMPHPKMDALVEGLESSWRTGRKALVFVRRVASVKEIKRKLDERYDRWLLRQLRARMPVSIRPDLDRAFDDYMKAKPIEDDAAAAVDVAAAEGEDEDAGGTDTFFAWFFRGTARNRGIGGRRIQQRFRASGAYATFFHDNHVMALLDAEPGHVLEQLARELGVSPDEARNKLARTATRYLTRAKEQHRETLMEAAQGSALELLAARSESPLAARARAMWEEACRASRRRDAETAVRPELSDRLVGALEHATFFNELRRPAWASLRAQLWPTPRVSDAARFRVAFREQQLRMQLLGTAARLGHAFIDLYIETMQDDASVEGGAVVDASAETRLISRYLHALEGQRGSDAYGALRELAEISENFALIIDTNLPDARPEDTKSASLSEAHGKVVSLLRAQQPTGGMAGKINRTLVSQFRMPGYPFVLVTTDLLQEGEDLHTFCSSVHHYGISWTPSAMEQRIGRIDRVRSQTDRRLSALDRNALGDEKLQVHFPHLQETIEVLQVERLLERMHKFMQLMHDGLGTVEPSSPRVDVAGRMVGGRKQVEYDEETALVSAFPIKPEMLAGARLAPVTTPHGLDGHARIGALGALSELGGLKIDWTLSPPIGTQLGTATLESRTQPFLLSVRADRGRLLVRCVSPIGRTDPETNRDAIAELAVDGHSRVGAILTNVEHTYDLTVEDDVLLAAPQHDAARIGLLVRRVVKQADDMEHGHFDGERDAPMKDFEEQLRAEVGDDD